MKDRIKTFITKHEAALTTFGLGMVAGGLTFGVPIYKIAASGMRVTSSDMFTIDGSNEQMMMLWHKNGCTSTLRKITD